MSIKNKKPEVNVLVFHKTCMVVESCVNYEQLKIAMNYVNLYYSMFKDFTTYTHLQKLISKKLEQVTLIKQ